MPANLKDSDFEITQISHELKNSVTFISSSLQLISKEHPEALSYHYWPSVLDEVHHLHQLLNDISQFQTGNLLFMETISFQRFAKDLLEILRPTLLEKGQNLYLDLPEKMITISLDKHKIRQVLENLIKNASEASDYKNNIYWKVSLDKDFLINEIIDEGQGLCPEHIPTLFDPFVTTKASGTGLGLPICKKIVENHQGHIYCHPNKQKGSTFGFRIPYSVKTKI